MTDLVLAAAHHLAVFTLVAIFAAEFAIMRRGFKGVRVALLGRVDLFFGISAAAVLVVGFLRVFYGAAGPDYYLTNWVFWAKIAAFAGVGLLSLPPTLMIFGWRREALIDPDYSPPDEEVARARRFMYGEGALLALIPVFAAMMARGVGL
jgi:putative membrane protein